jgi:hypothetical protein
MRDGVPLVVKVAYSLWMAVWVPVYWVHNGPSNFLWICDFANLVTLVAIWSESALLVSSQLAGIFLIQVLWAVDFFGRLLTGSHLLGGTEYMFDASSPVWLRLLSLFHLWTVPLLAWLMRRVGHDRRGVLLESLVALVLFPLGQQLGSVEQNLNWMWLPLGVEQTLLPPLLFAFASVPVAALLLFVPGDRLARRLFVRRDAGPLPHP